MTYELQRIPTEHEEQRELIRWFRQTYLDVRIFAIPNGGGRSKAAGARFKAEGVSAGVPDLFIPAWRLWIEMKRTKGGSVSTEQQDWAKYLSGVGYKTIFCRGFEDAKNKIHTLEKGTDENSKAHQFSYKY